MKELIKDVTKLVNEELERTMKNYPLFNSKHEGYAVIKEEIDEASDELQNININLEIMWNVIKNNKNTNNFIYRLKDHAGLLAAEAIQVAAMAQKYIDSFKEAEINE